MKKIRKGRGCAILTKYDIKILDILKNTDKPISSMKLYKKLNGYSNRIRPRLKTLKEYEFIKIERGIRNERVISLTGRHQELINNLTNFFLKYSTR